MSAVLGYVGTLGVYFFIYNIFCIGLNIQFGYAGILDFTVITFMAVAGYFAGVAVLGPPQRGSQIFYVLGLDLPWPVALVIGVVAAGALGFLIGLVALRRLRSDYLAIVTLASGSIVYGIINNDDKIFDGGAGLVGVSQPFGSYVSTNPNTYTEFFLIICFFLMICCWLFANRLYSSPLGRAMRAIREDVDVAEAYGKNSFKIRMTAMVIGCVMVGVGGALTIAYVTALSPAGWSTGETFVIWAALIVGGRGNNWGAVVGSFLVAVLFNEATRFLPNIPGHPNMISDIRNMAIGGLVILTLWFREQGVIPERKAKFLELPIRDGGGSPKQLIGATAGTEND